MQVIDTHAMSGMDGSLDRDHAAPRAKEVMVQITAFGDATTNEPSSHISTGWMLLPS